MVQNDGWYIVFLNRYSGVHELVDYPMYMFFIATKDIFKISADILNRITAFYSKYMCFELWKDIEYLLYASHFEILQANSNWSNRTKKSQELPFLSHLNNNHPNNSIIRYIHLRPSSVRAKASDIFVNTKKPYKCQLILFYHISIQWYLSKANSCL